MGVIQEINLVLSKTAVAALTRQLDEASKQITQTIEKAVNAGGADQKARDAAIARVRALKTELDREARALSQAVEKGLLGVKEAAVLGQDAGRAYGEALAKELAKAQKAGILTKTDLAVIAKETGQATGLGRSLFDLAPPDPKPWEGFFGRIKSLALGVGGAIAGVFALSKLKDFALDSIREFLKDAQQLDDLRSTVKGLGLDFEQLRPAIDDASDAFVRAGRGSGSDFQRILQQLTLTSGDYQKSIRNVTLVSDLAAARQMSLEQATQLVGRAMIGQVEPLRRLGIEVKKGEDGVLALNAAVGGFVERQGPTWGRSLTALKNTWTDLKSAIGEALLSAGGGTSTFDQLTGVVQGLTKYVRENKDSFRELGQFVVQAAGFLAKDLIASIRDAEQAFLDLGATIDKANAAWLRIQAFGSRAGAELRLKLGDTEGFLRLTAEADRLEAEAASQAERAADRRARSARLLADERRDALGLSGVESGASSSAAPTAPPAPSGVGGAVTGATNNPRGTGTGHTDRDPLGTEIRQLAEAVKFENLKAEATTRLQAIEAALQAKRAAGNLTLAQQTDLERKLRDVRQALGEETVLTSGAIGQQVDLLTRFLPLTNTHAFAVAELTKRQQAYREELEQLISPERRLELIKALDEINQALTADRFRQNQQQHGGQPGSLPGGPPDVTIDPATLDKIERDTERSIREPLQKGDTEIKVSGFLDKAIGKDLQEVAGESAEFIGDEFGAVFDQLFSDAENLQNVFANLGKGLAAGLLKEIAIIAGAESKKNIARGIEMTATGFADLFLHPAKAAADFKSAGLFFATAAAWSALGGVAGVGGSALSQTGGGGGGGRSGLEDRSSDRLNPGGRATATLIINGGDFLNTKDRGQMDQLAKALSLVSDYNVVIKRGAA